MQVTEHMLKEEIEFWRSMIENRKGEISEQTAERMINARELAERKLLLVQEGPSHEGQRHYFD